MAQPLRPTLKERKRYVVYAPADDDVVIGAYQELFGTHGAANAGIRRVTQEADTSILRVAHDAVDRLKAALVWTGKHSIIVSGTLKRAREALV